VLKFVLGLLPIRYVASDFREPDDIASLIGDAVDNN
jgi:hypothetical protein